MKKKFPKPVAKTYKKSSNMSGQIIIPPAYEINFIDRQTNSNDAPVQGMFESSPEETVSVDGSNKNASAVSSKSLPNNTGLPDSLKTGIENLSGYSMDDVKVHYNSEKPAQLLAHAYTQGTNIHVASGQERHLPHEAWHVVQQKQGKVKPTFKIKGTVNINDNAGLEKEADVMGTKALQQNASQNGQNIPKVQQLTEKGVLQQRSADGEVVQMMNRFDLENAGKLWFSEVWVGGQNDNYNNRDQIITNFNALLAGTGFRIGRGWQPYDPVVRPARKYTTIAQELDNASVANALAFEDFLDGNTLLANLPTAALQELALITCFAEVGRGYSSSLTTLKDWVNTIAAGNSTWSQVKINFDPSLTYAEDSRQDWQ